MPTRLTVYSQIYSLATFVYIVHCVTTSGALGDKKDEGGGTGAKEIDPEVEEALREAEQRRQEKHRKMEEEREAMRQDIRDKVSYITIYHISNRFAGNEQDGLPH